MKYPWHIHEISEPCFIAFPVTMAPWSGTALNHPCSCCSTIAWSGFRTCGMWTVAGWIPALQCCLMSIKKKGRNLVPFFHPNPVFSFRIPRNPKDQVDGSYQESVVNDEIDNRDTNGYKVVLRYMLVSELTKLWIYLYIFIYYIYIHTPYIYHKPKRQFLA